MLMTQRYYLQHVKVLKSTFHYFSVISKEVHTGHTNQPDKPSKTEVLFAAAPSTRYENPSTYDDRDLSNVEISNCRFLPIVDTFCYLGSILTRNCRDEEDVKSRIKSAGNAFGALRKCLFSNPSILLDAKRTVYEGLVLSILLYGSECWCLTEDLFRLLRVFHAQCVRAMFRFESTDGRHVSSESALLNRGDLQSIDVYISRRQLQWAGHVARMDFDRLPRKMLSSRVTEKRSVGAPEFTYGRGLFKNLKKGNIET